MNCTCLICHHTEPIGSNVWLDQIRSRVYEGTDYCGICRACAPYLATAVLKAFYSESHSHAEYVRDIIAVARTIYVTAPHDQYAIKFHGAAT